MASEPGGAARARVAVAPRAREAAAAGFDAVKVQFLNPDAMYPPGDARRERLRPFVLTLDELEVLRAVSDECGIDLGASVFAPEDVREVAARVDYLKIASSESMWSPLVEAVATSDVDWMISTPPGWHKPDCWDDIHSRGLGHTARLHCVPIYPTPVELAYLDGLGRDVISGYSDHTRNQRVVSEAVVLWDAHEVELHWAASPVLCSGGWCAEQPELAHSWTPETFSGLLTEITHATMCDGDEGVRQFVADGFWSKSARDLKTGYRR